MKLLRLATTLLFILQSFNLLAQKSITIKKSGHIDSTDVFKLCYVPIGIPAGITEIRVQERYSSQGKNVLNMGVYAPGDYSLGKTANFRGWSGGAKNNFFINEADASTGYIPGKIKPGTWHVLIYPSTIIAAGLDWILEITLVKSEPKKPFIIKPAKAVVNQTAGWYSGDLHMHTLHSDGKRTEQELIDEAVSKKLDYIISTEHNTNSANLKWGNYDQKNLLIINGEEVTTTAFGHWNALGLKTNTLIEWRYTPADNAIKKYTDMVHKDGGLCIINHPFYAKDLSNSFKFDPFLFDGIEIWNGNWDLMDAKALKWWDDFLKQGHHLLATGASDTHKATGSENNLGEPRTVVYAKSLSKSGILTGLKSRNVYLTATGDMHLTFDAKVKNQQASIGDSLMGIDGENVTVTLNAANITDAIITLIGDHGTLFTESTASPSHQWTVKAGATKYIRAEIRTPQGKMLALTNPIWLSN